VLWWLILLALPNICQPICDMAIGISISIGIGIGIGHCRFTIVCTFSEHPENNPSAMLHPSRFLSFSSPLHSFMSICSQWLFHISRTSLGCTCLPLHSQAVWQSLEKPRRVRHSRGILCMTSVVLVHFPEVGLVHAKYCSTTLLGPINEMSHTIKVRTRGNVFS